MIENEICKNKLFTKRDLIDTCWAAKSHIKKMKEYTWIYIRLEYYNLITWAFKWKWDRTRISPMEI